MRAISMVLALIITALAAGPASAFTLDQAAGTNADGSSRFGDPDDKMPFPHRADDGQPANFDAQQPVGNSGFSFGMAPSSSQSPDAFQRTKQRMQQ